MTSSSRPPGFRPSRRAFCVSVGSVSVSLQAALAAQEPRWGVNEARSETLESIGEAQKKTKAEGLMVIADMIHSCSNAHVAKAAVFCIGGAFAERVGAAARERGMELGGFVAVIVQEFARRADGEAMQALSREIAGADQPILRGLACLLEPTLEAEICAGPEACDLIPAGLHDRRHCGSLAYAH